MKLYLCVIGLSMLAVSVFNLLFGTACWYYVLIAVVVCTALQFLIDGGVAFLVHKLPDKWFDVDSPSYRVSPGEIKLYQKLKVRAWKDRVWELGGLGGFSKKALKEPNNPYYIERFVIECHKGVLTHRLSYPAGFLAMLILPNACAFTIALPIAIVNLFLNILPTIVLRYNTPTLISLLRRLEKRQAKRMEKEKETVSPL